MSAEPFLSVESYVFISISKQAGEFLGQLDAHERAQLVSAAALLAKSLAVGRPCSRSERVKGTRVKVFELKITPPGSRGPQLRLLYFRERRQILVARGYRKKQPGLPAGEVALAERAWREWREQR